MLLQLPERGTSRGAITEKRDEKNIPCYDSGCPCGGVRKRRGRPAGLPARAAATATRLDRPFLRR
jgi:hypothetical protein